MGRKIYFAGSIRGGRVDADLYRRIIEHIKVTDVVLTEHIGKQDLSVAEQDASADSLIYRQDTGWLLQSDMVVAECTCPSLGVGYELAFAESHGICCHILYDTTKTQLSAMLKGNGYFHVHPYRTEAQLMRILDEILGA